LKEITGKVKPGYVGKPKGAAQIAAERGFISLDGLLENGKKYINITLILIPKCHPEIAGRGIEYCWSYSKLRFRRDFNDAIAKHSLLCILHGKEASAGKDDIEHITKLFKAHRSAMDSDFSFIANC